jgi:HPt (histidine-containing phosphotransfer) domain-containing protein
MSEPLASQMSEAMNRLWVKFLPEIEERVSTLESAAAQVANGSTLTDQEQIKAAAEAHKLAGVLGTFGLSAGTDLAREAEGLCGEPLDDDPAKATRLHVIAEQLKAMIASRG